MSTKGQGTQIFGSIFELSFINVIFFDICCIVSLIKKLLTLKKSLGENKKIGEEQLVFRESPPMRTYY